MKSIPQSLVDCSKVVVVVDLPVPAALVTGPVSGSRPILLVRAEVTR